MPREFARSPSPDQRQEYEMADRIDRTGGTCRSSDCYPFSGLFDIGRIGNSFEKLSLCALQNAWLDLDSDRAASPLDEDLLSWAYELSYQPGELLLLNDHVAGSRTGHGNALKARAISLPLLRPNYISTRVRRRPFNYVQYTSSESRTAGSVPSIISTSIRSDQFLA